MKDTSVVPTGSRSNSTLGFSNLKRAVAQSVNDITDCLDKPFRSITITQQVKSEDCFALSATVMWWDGTETEHYWQVRGDISKGLSLVG